MKILDATQRLRAATVHAVLRVRIAFASLATSVSYRSLSAQAKASLYAAQAASSLFSAQVNYLRLRAEAALGDFLLFVGLADSLSAIDRAIKTFGRGLSEAPRAIDAISQKLIGKPRSSAAAATDSSRLLFGKSALDTATTTDAQIRGVGKRLDDTPLAVDQLLKGVATLRVDALVANDQLSRAVDYRRTAADLMSAGDASQRNVGKTSTELLVTADERFREVAKSLSDIASVTDDVNGAAADDDANWSFFSNRSELAHAQDTFTRTVSYLRSHSDGAVSFDVVARGSTKALNHSASTSDGGSVMSQGYVAGEYFAQDYVGSFRTF